MKYISTRGNYQPVSSAQAIIQGMVPRGGLFVPESIPEIDVYDLRGLSYQKIAFQILKLFLGNTGSGVDYSDEVLQNAVQKAYSGNKFDHPDIAPLKILDKKTAVLELWHGPTAAFKDMALQIMPYFMSSAKDIEHNNKETVILVATSGDTGKAALEGYKDVPGVRVIVFYPKDFLSFFFSLPSFIFFNLSISIFIKLFFKFLSSIIPCFNSTRIMQSFFNQPMCS